MISCGVLLRKKQPFLGSGDWGWGSFFRVREGGVGFLFEDVTYIITGDWGLAF